MPTCEHDFDSRFCPYCRGNIKGDYRPSTPEERQHEQQARAQSRARHLCIECGLRLADALVNAGEPVHPTCDREVMPPITRNTTPLARMATDTSYEAAKRALPDSGTKRRIVYDLILSEGGLCDHEIEERTGWLHQSASSARNSLMNDGWVRASLRRRKTPGGNDAIVWEAVPMQRKEPDHGATSDRPSLPEHHSPTLPLLSEDAD